MAIWAIVICGFFNSIMFPNIFALGIAGPWPDDQQGLGADYDGGRRRRHRAAADRRGGRQAGSIQNAFMIPAICYLFIAYYGLWGSKPTRTVKA